jgi:hypothetical protein
MPVISRLLLGFAVAAVAAELALQALPVSTGYGFMGVDDANPILRGTPYVHYVYSRNWNFRLENAGRLNNYGFRASHDFEPDPRALLVIGNSFIAADAIVPPENMTEQTGGLLGRPAYAIGVDGFSLADYVVAARWGAHTFWPRSADVPRFVLVLLTTGDLNRACDSRLGEHYLRVRDDHMSIALVPRATPSALKRWVNESMLFRYMFDNLRASANWGRPARPGSGPREAGARTPAGGCASAELASAATAFLLGAFREFENESGARVVFVLAPGYRPEQGYAAGALRDVDAFAGHAEQEGFQVVRLESAFLAALRAGERLDFMPIDGHWNIAANAIAARVIAASLPAASLTADSRAGR